MQQKEVKFYVGSIPIDGRLILAPMDGFSDVPFRLLCRQFGSAMSYVPFISARKTLQDSELSRLNLHFDQRERPVVFQLYGNDVTRLHKAALRLENLGIDMIDINMGCSNRRVSRRGAGAGLLLDTQKIASIIGKLSADLDIPITAKIRLGWDEKHRNYLEVARTIADNNGAMIAVHGRTRQQKYKGKADWDAIAEIKQAVSIPVIGNGDIESTADIHRFLAHTACDGVMIGRAAIGNPWIFQNKGQQKVSDRELSAVIFTHYKWMTMEYGERLGMLRFRKHLKRYLNHAPKAEAFRKDLLTADDRQTFFHLLAQAGFHQSVEINFSHDLNHPNEDY